LRSEIDRSGLGETVTLLGGLSREQVRSLYLQADVYVAPAYQESFGIAALEARAAG
jgi:glycosyltransferase involved in cell wall biosynthesis